MLVGKMLQASQVDLIDATVCHWDCCWDLAVECGENKWKSKDPGFALEPSRITLKKLYETWRLTFLSRGQKFGWFIFLPFLKKPSLIFLCYIHCLAWKGTHNLLIFVYFPITLSHRSSQIICSD
jgi:hypothetical protein